MAQESSTSFCNMVRNKLKSEMFIGAAEAYSAFPKNPRDAEHFCYIWERETEASGDLRIKKEQSQVFSALSNVLRKKDGRGVVAGLVALSYSYLNFEYHIGTEQHGSSLERASTLASEAAYSVGHAVCGNRAIKLCGDKADVKSIFREYRSYAHIWAARLCHDDYMKIHNIEERNLQFMFLASFFRKELQIIANVEKWGMAPCPIPDTFNNNGFFPSAPWGALQAAYEKCRSRGDL